MCCRGMFEMLKRMFTCLLTEKCFTIQCYEAFFNTFVLGSQNPVPDPVDLFRITGFKCTFRQKGFFVFAINLDTPTIYKPDRYDKLFGEDHENAMQRYYAKITYYLYRAGQIHLDIMQYMPLMCEALRYTLSDIIGPFPGSCE